MNRNDVFSFSFFINTCTKSKCLRAFGGNGLLLFFYYYLFTLLEYKGIIVYFFKRGDVVTVGTLIESHCRYIITGDNIYIFFNETLKYHYLLITYVIWPRDQTQTTNKHKKTK